MLAAATTIIKLETAARHPVESRRGSPGVAVVCLTASVSRTEIAELYEAGAVACLTKDEALDEIVAAIHQAAS